LQFGYTQVLLLRHHLITFARLAGPEHTMRGKTGIMAVFACRSMNTGAMHPRP
jgi:hypothetical protein